MNIDRSVLDLIKGMDAMELLELIAYAKKGDDAVISAVSVKTVEDACEALGWFLELLGEG